jgi:hypothetical protein
MLNSLKVHMRSLKLHMNRFTVLNDAPPPTISPIRLGIAAQYRSAYMEALRKAIVLLDKDNGKERPCKAPFCELQHSLFGWVEQNGGYIHPSLELSTGQNPNWKIRGLFSTTFIPEGEVLVSLPQDILLCAFPDNTTKWGDKRQCHLIYKLVEELKKGEQSRYWPYLSSMDDHEIDIPAVWSHEERQLLSGLYPTDWTRHTKWFESACDGNLNDPVAVRAMLLMVARSHGVRDDGSCLSPIYDVMNHSPSENTKVPPSPNLTLLILMVTLSQFLSPNLPRTPTISSRR